MTVYIAYHDADDRWDIVAVYATLESAKAAHPGEWIWNVEYSYWVSWDCKTAHTIEAHPVLP